MNTLRISTAIVTALAISPVAMGTDECDEWKPFGDGLSYLVFALGVYDGDLIALGSFNTMDDVARWNGESWEQLGEGLMTGSAIYDTDLITFEGDLIATGSVGLQDGSHFGFVRWDGNAWQAFGNQACSHNPVAVAVAGGELYLGLRADTECEHHIDGFDNPIGGVLRWTGEYWTQVGDSSELGRISAMAEYDGDLVTADFTSDGTLSGSVRRWNGESWELLGEVGGHPVRTLTAYNGDLIAGGEFESIDGLPLQRIARYDGEQWLAMTLGMDHTIRDLHVHNGELYAGGRFEIVAENPADRLVRWNGLTWVEFEGGASGQIRSITSHQGNLVIGGSFTEVGDGITANSVAQFDACPPLITGACCTSGGCVNVTIETCDAIGGAYLGNDVTCAEADCATCPGDLNLDGMVDVRDLFDLLSAWGPCP